jgi:EmrB/QacA subfamily drug resistance transporter
MLALLLASLDQSIVGTAMPRIIAELNGLNDYAWVTTAYLVSSTVLVPIAGKLGDMFGRKPFVLVGMLGFMASSWLAGFSQNMTELIAFRGIQGLFGGMLFATVFTVLADIYTVEQRTRIQGLFSGVFGLSSIIGPTTGGYITDHWGWRWIFYVNVPVGVLGLIMVLIFLPYVRSRANWRDIDFLGSATLAAGLVPLLIALSITNTHAWTSPEVLGLLGVAGVMLITFCLIERRVENPIVPFGLFRNNAFSVSVIVAFFSAFAMFGSIIFVPLVYQGVLGVSATNSGTLLTPMMGGLIVFSTLAAQLMVRIRFYRFLGTAGSLAMIAGMWLLAQVTPSTPRWEVARDLVIIGAGLGMTFPLTISVVQAALPRRVVGVATSQIQFWRNLGGTVGTAVLGSILARQLTPDIQSRIAALHLPPQFQQVTARMGSGGSPQALLNPQSLAQTRAQLPPQAQPAFDQIVHAIQLGLADALHDLFLIGAAMVVVSVVATLFLREVPLRRGGAAAGMGEAPPTPEAAEEAPAAAPRPALPAPAAAMVGSSQAGRQETAEERHLQPALSGPGTARRAHMLVRYVSGVVWSLLTGLAGGWMLFSPWALGQQGSGSWTTTTWSEFGAGLGLLALAVAGFIVTLRSLIGDLREVGALPRRAPKPKPAPKPEPARSPEPAPTPTPQPVAIQDLARALASELVRMETDGNGAGQAPQRERVL